MKLRINLLLVLLAATLSACSLHRGHSIAFGDPSAPPPHRLPAAQILMAEAKQQMEPERSATLLKAADRYIDAEYYARARSLLYKINDRDLSAHDQIKRRLILAKYYLFKRQPNLAQGQLSQIDMATLEDPALQQQYYQLSARLYRQYGNTTQMIRALVLAVNFSAEPYQHQRYTEQLWQHLMQHNTNSLDTLFGEYDDVDWQGWIALARAFKAPEMAMAITDWRQQYPGHVAQSLLGDGAEFAKQPHKIALLLPLTGPLAAPGRATRDGFMTAYYKDKRPNRPKVQVYNTARAINMRDLYEKVTDQGADFIVGPLGKDQVDDFLSHSSRDIPIVTLNYSQSGSSDNVFQFGLAPLDEMKQVANRAWQSGYQHALLIAPQTPWGQKNADALVSQWEALGGEITDSFYFDHNTHFNSAIKSLLHVDQSVARKKQLQRILNKKLKSTPYRRQDIDVILLVADAKAARQIRPLLKFYYAGNIPVFASSTVYDAYPNARRDRDLNGILFCDMPWVFGKGQSVQHRYNQHHALWPAGLNRYTRLYALGQDSYLLTRRLNQLAWLPNMPVRGHTGNLYLTSGQQIYRRLKWAQFKKGYAKLKPSLS